MTHTFVFDIILMWGSWNIVSFVLADLHPDRFGYLGWFWYITVQLVMLFFTVVGWFLLLPFCVRQAWVAPNGDPPVTEAVYLPWSFSDKDGSRRIDCWAWLPLNWVYGNPEDGVSGQCAIIYLNGNASPYMPHASAWWRAYCWSALRNSCDNLKYVFAWRRGPQAMFLGHKVGWWDENGYKVPVL